MTTGTDMPPAPTASDKRFLSELAPQLRADSIRCSTAGSCRPAPGQAALPGVGAVRGQRVKPVDLATLAGAAAASGGPLVIAEDHYPQGALGAAVLEALAGVGLLLRVRPCAVSGLSGSGTPDQLMEAAGISASRIAAN